MSEDLSRFADRALRHIKATGFDDIFKPPMFGASVEYAVLAKGADEIEKYFKSEAAKFIRCRDFDKCSIGKPREYFIPKDKFTFRKVAWFDPLDIVKYTSLVLMLTDKIEAARTPIEKNVVHSHRLSDVGDTLFEKDYGYTSFRLASKAKSKFYAGGFKLLTDISNFFDRINLHALENILSEIGCDENTIRFLNEVLLHFSSRNSFGLPVGCDASRILSEVALINVDKHLQRLGIDFVRYVDDYRIFSMSRVEIQKSLLALTKSLNDEGLFLNFSKTNLISIVSEAIEPEMHDQTGYVEAHKSIDEHEQVVFVRKLGGVSGRSVISKHYMKPGFDAINNLKGMDKGKLISNLSMTNGSEQEKSIRDACKYYIYVDHDLHIIKTMLREKITSIVYLSDCLVKDGDRLSPETRNAVVDCILDEMSLNICPYPYVLPVIKVITSRLFLRTDIIIDVVENAYKFGNDICFREIMLLASNHIPRTKLKSLCRDGFSTRPVEIQRALMHVAQTTDVFSRGEKDAILKDMLNSSNDVFLRHI